MFRTIQRAHGLFGSVSKHQISRSAFGLGTIRSSKQIHGGEGHLSQACHLLQKSEIRLGKDMYCKEFTMRLERRASSSSSTMSTQETGQVTVRPATHADCDAIKAIDRDIHDGFDRFLYYFHYDVGMETKFSYVAEISGQIVAYSTGHIIDDGDTIVMRDGRVLKEHQGKRVYRMLSNVILTAAKSQFPNLKWRASMSLDEEAVRKNLAKFPSMKKPLSTLTETFLIHSDQLKAVSKSKAFCFLANKYQIDAIASFSKYEALRLLTEEIRYLDFAPRRPMIGWQPSGWLASTLGNQLQVTDLFISRCPDTKNIQAFSFLTTMRGDYGVKTGIEFYGDPREKIEDFAIAHLLHFIRELTRFHNCTNFIAYVHHPVDVSRECVRDVLNVHLGIPSHFSCTSNVQEIRLPDAEQKRKL